MLLGLSDILGPNILDESRFKPCWEKIREYSIRGLMLTSLLMFSVQWTGNQIQCTPRYRSANYTMTSTQSMLANDVCYHQQDPLEKFAGIIAICASTILYACFSSWTVFPEIISGFWTVKRVDDVLMNKHVTPKQVKDAVTMPCIPNKNEAKRNDKLLKGLLSSDNEDHIALMKVLDESINYQNDGSRQRSNMIRGLCREVYLPHRYSAIPYWYLLRSVLSVVCAVSLVILNVVYCVLEWQRAPNSFLCILPEYDQLIIGTGKLLCSTNLAQSLYPYSILYMIFTIMLLLVGCYATVWVLINLGKTTVTILDEANENIVKSSNANRDCFFMQEFNSFSRLLHESTRELLKLSSDEEVLRIMNKNHINALILADSTFIDLYMAIHKDGKDNVDNFMNNGTISSNIISWLAAPRQGHHMQGGSRTQDIQPQDENSIKAANALAEDLVERLKRNSRTDNSDLMDIIL